MRHGAFPAVMAAPMTSSDVLPAGISCAVTRSLGWGVFHAFTRACLEVGSSGLLDGQTLPGPCAVSAAPEAVEPPEPPHAAVVPNAKVMMAAAQTCFFIMTPFGGGSARIRAGPYWVRRCLAGMAARLKLE